MIDKRAELAKMGELLRNPDTEARVVLLRYLLKTDILDQGFSTIEKTALISAVFYYFPCSEEVAQKLRDVVPAPISSLKKITRQLLINKFEHFIAYTKQASASKESMSFNDYYNKSGLNRAISLAWKDKKALQKGVLETLLQTKDRDPEECFYIGHIDLCLSLDPEHDYFHCLKILLHFLEKEVVDLKTDTYAFFLIKRLATEFDFEAKNTAFKTLLAEWEAQKFPPTKLRDFFCSVVIDRYFYSTYNESSALYNF